MSRVDHAAAAAAIAALEQQQQDVADVFDGLVLEGSHHGHGSGGGGGSAGIQMMILQYHIPPHAPIELIFDPDIAIQVKGVQKRVTVLDSKEPLTTLHEVSEDEDDNHNNPKDQDKNEEDENEEDHGKEKNKKQPKEDLTTTSGGAADLERLVGLYVDSLDLPGLRMSHFPQTQHLERLLKANASVPRRITFRAFPPPPLPTTSAVAANPQQSDHTRATSHHYDHYWSGGCLYRHVIPSSTTPSSSPSSSSKKKKKKKKTPTTSSTHKNGDSPQPQSQPQPFRLGLVLEGFPPVVKSVEAGSLLDGKVKPGQVVHSVEAPHHARRPLLDRHTPGFTAHRILAYLQEETLDQPLRYLTLRDQPPVVVQGQSSQQPQDTSASSSYQEHHHRYLNQLYRGSRDPFDLGGFIPLLGGAHQKK